MTINFTFYYRENCHLCESMRLALVKLRQQHEFDWDEIDIDRDTDLIFRFDTLVPVLYHQDREVCHYFLEREAIGRILAE